MKKDELVATIDQTLGLLLEVADDYIDEIAEELAVVASPEKLIGKNYESWTSQDMMMLSQVYGEGDDTPLARVVFNKEYEKVKELEEGELK